MAPAESTLLSLPTYRDHVISDLTQVIEYVLGVNRHGPLQSSTVQQFVESVGSRTSTPGGGSVSALVTALGLALGQCNFFI